MQLTDVSVDQFDPDELNPNRMPPEQYQALLNVMRKEGLVQNVVAWKNDQGRYTMADGHHRLKAAMELGIKELPTYIVKDRATARSMMLVLNNVRGEIQLDLAATLLAELHNNEGWSVEDLQVTGFSTDEINDLLAVTGSNPDDILGGGIPADPLNDEPPAMEMDRDTKSSGGMVIELEFDSKQDYRRVQKALKNAAKGGSLAHGMLDILDRVDVE